MHAATATASIATSLGYAGWQMSEPQASPSWHHELSERGWSRLAPSRQQQNCPSLPHSLLQAAKALLHGSEYPTGALESGVQAMRRRSGR